MINDDNVNYHFRNLLNEQFIKNKKNKKPLNICMLDVLINFSIARLKIVM